MRNIFLSKLVDHILNIPNERILRVAINGVDGSGKTCLADELVPLLITRGARVIRSSIDGFHNPRAVRYAKGRRSPEGFYKDSFNIAEFKAAILQPLSPNGDLIYRTAAFDHRIDKKVDVQPTKAKLPSILLMDGIFILNHELRGYFDLSIFLDVSFEETFRRMVTRDDTPLDPDDPINLRCKGGQQLYFAECNPKAYADIVIDYNDINAPRFL